MDAVVDISQRSELCLEHDVLLLCVTAVIKAVEVADERHERDTAVLVPLFKLLTGGRLCGVDLLEGQVLPFHDAVEVLKKCLFVKELACQHGLFLIFIGVERCDPLLGGAVLFVGKALFLQTIQLLVPRQQQ